MRPAPPPHLGRLRARLDDLAGPVVQVWGWPGTGRRALLEAVLAEAGAEAHPLALAEVADPESLVRSLARPAVAAARWLVALDLPAGAISSAVGLLRPGQRLLFAGRRRLAPGAPGVSYLLPRELLLTGEEAERVLSEVGPRRPGRREGEQVLELAGGWLLPLRLLARAAASGGAEGLRQALGSAPLRGFLEVEVLGALAPDLAEALGRLARGEAVEEEAVATLAEVHGLGEGSGGAPLPPLLRDHLVARGPAAGGAPSGPAGAAPDLRVQLLGNPRVVVVAAGRETEIHWPLRRAFHLLAYLASSPERAAGREELIEAVWSGEDGERIRKNFHPTVTWLRRTLERVFREARGTAPPPFLGYVNRIYRLAPELAWEVDVVELSRCAEAGRRELEAGRLEAGIRHLEEAWKLYRGPFLAGDYAPWVVARREETQRLHLDLLRELGDACSRLDRLGEAMDAYRSVLAIDPLEERVHLSVMRLYARRGRRDLVRRQYDRLAGLLQEELGVEPLPQTAQEYHRLMA